MISLAKLNKSLVAMLSVISIFVFTELHAQRYYKWTDADGQTVYSQTPPPVGIKAERVGSGPAAAEDPEQAMQDLRDRAKAFGERREDRLTLEKEGQAALEKKKQLDKTCEQLRKNLEILQNSARVRENVEGGEPVILSEEVHQEKIKQTQERIQKECTENK